MKNKLLVIVPILVWLVIGIYGIFYNITYIDEAKYLIKGWLMTTGQVGYYATPEFSYQHMPGGLLWFGLGQKLFGPNLLVARVQSFLLGLLIIWFSYKLVALINPKAKKNILPILSLTPVAILYYSSAVTQALAALTLVLAFYWLFKNNFFLTTTWFTLAFIVRENFLFTLILYFVYLLIYQRKIWLVQAALAIGIISLFFLPGWPGILNVLKNFPGVSMLLPVSAAEKAVLSLNWMVKNYDWSLYIRAVKEFGVIYFSLLLIGLISLINGIKSKSLWIKDNRWRLLLIITGFNFLAHTWSAFILTPRAIIGYFTYIFPLVAVIIAVILPEKKIKTVYLPLLIISLITIPMASIFQSPNHLSTIYQLKLSSQALKPIVANKNNIIWLSEPMSLYLAGKISYYPLINHTNFYKPSNDTQTVRKLGFWNQEMMAEWLNEADLVVIDNNRLKIVSDNNLTQIIENKVNNNYTLIQTPGNIWPGNLSFFSK
ncbi:hypothetical protein KKE48_00010 [Patescibacteria group bacterium]|nr:hypothetical protein [Patescibacteria group bacterium]MBU1499239.1 hypothetical protein [Patescibacteria group bacterium]